MLGGMPISNSDHVRAAREHGARQCLLEAGAASLSRAPWRHPSQPPSSVDLVRFAVWRGETGTTTDEEVEAALTLLSAARAEMEQLETGILFTARTHGWSWGRIARGMGLGSAQAALQRFDRLAGRAEPRAES
jgi:hypothetical protein